MSGGGGPRGRAEIAPRAAAALALLAALLAAVELSHDVQRLLEPVNVALARAVELVLALTDVPVSRRGALLAHPDGFSVRITHVCSGVRPAVVVAVALIVVPASARARLAGLAAAVVVLEGLNLLRLTHLYWTGVEHPEAFFFAHRVAWNLVFVAAVAGLLALWLAAARQRFSSRGLTSSAKRSIVSRATDKVSGRKSNTKWLAPASR